MPFPCHAVLLRANPFDLHSAAVFDSHVRPIHTHHAMVCVNQTWPHCVNHMGKIQSKPLAERHGRGTAWEQHGMCESAFSLTQQHVRLQHKRIRLCSLTECEAADILL
jgi:hypothetical protein